MALHPVIAGFLGSLPAPEGEPAPLNPEAMRAGDEAHVAPLAERLPLHEVRDVDAGGVPARFYRAEEGPAAGVIVYLHGGAFFLGSLETHDHVARELAKATGLVVVSAGYRLAPEHAFPAGLDDSFAVVQWAAANRDSLGVTGDVLAVAGDSSGGTFAAAIAARAVDEGAPVITHQVLLYPSLDLDFDESRYASLVENAVGYGLETAGLRPFNAFYLDSGADAADPQVSPINRADLAGLPKALVVTAQYDPLRDEGELYAARLAEAGVPTVARRFDGAGHGFVQHFGWLEDYHGVYAEIAEFLRS